MYLRNKTVPSKKKKKSCCLLCREEKQTALMQEELNYITEVLKKYFLGKKSL